MANIGLMSETSFGFFNILSCTSFLFLHGKNSKFVTGMSMTGCMKKIVMGFNLPFVFIHQCVNDPLVPFV
jgi:hypothetical protein